MDGQIANHTSAKVVFNEIREFIGRRNQLLYPLWVLPFLAIAVLEMVLGLDYGRCPAVVDACIKFGPVLIGLCFAMMVFLYKMDDETKKRVMQHTDKYIAPVRVFFSMITWFILTSLLVFILALLTSMIPCLLLYAFLYGSMCYGLCIFLQVILEMYTFHTFFYPLDADEMKKYEMHKIK